MARIKGGLKVENTMKTKSSVQTKLATHILHEANRICNDAKVVYLKIIPAETTPVVGNWDSETLERYKSIKVPKKFYMTF